MRLSEGRTSTAAVSLTPLIDVVFLLLIFFMLASTFFRFNVMPITATDRGLAKVDASEIVFIQVLGGQHLRVNGAALQVDGLLSFLDSLVAKGMTKAVVRPTSEATVQDLVSVLERTRRSTLTNVVIVR